MNLSREMIAEYISSSWFGRPGFHMLRGGGGSPFAFIMVAGLAPRSRGKGFVRIAVVCLCLLFALATPARPQGTFTTFHVPGAGTGMLQGTIPVSINAAGDITGIYFDANNFPLVHGFVRAADGTITKFDAPHAGTGAKQGTLPMSINTAGDIAGMYFDTNNAYHGFVRAAATGQITEFDVPGASAAGHRGTIPLSINAVGDITGIYADSSNVRRGFVRAANGTITEFAVPGAANTGQFQGTVPRSINAAGDIAGLYLGTDNVFHGFVRAPDGAITTFEAPGAGTGLDQGTAALSINSAGEITGIYTDTSPLKHSPIVGAHGFVRAANGAITEFDVPGVGTTGLLTGTLPFSINTAGEITGGYSDTSGVTHGFVRAADGTMTYPIDAPSAGTTGLFPGTLCASINDSGTFTGTYSDALGVFHGFLFTPAPTTARVSPGGLTFDAQGVRTASASQPVTLRNTGRAPLIIASITPSGDFSQTNACDGGLTGGDSCTINVTFTPTAQGTRRGTLTIVDNATGSPQVVRLTGVGTMVKLSPPALSFGNQPVRTTSSPQVVTLTNMANTPLRIYSIRITPAVGGLPGLNVGLGFQAGEFAETNTCGTAVAKGANCTIRVTFTPRRAGNAAAWLASSDSGAGSPQRVSLTGVGLQ
jgi:hypothetical protein